MKERKTKTQIEKDTKQRGLFKKTRGGEELTREQVEAIKEGRKKLRKQLKKAKVYTRKEFELTASSMGLYFDKHKAGGLLLWLFHGKALAALLGALVTLLAVLFIFSLITQMRGHFTINLSEDMFQDGFILSEDKDFTNPKSQLFSEPVEDAPCISISSIPADVDMQDGNHSGRGYFAYTFYLKYEGDVEDEVAYGYELTINAEGKDISSAAWVMLFVDGKMTLYTEKGADGKEEALPALGDDTRGYRNLPFVEWAEDPEGQFPVIATKGTSTFYRALPKPFETERMIASGKEEGVKAGDVHKYTVVMWLEGDDPDCTDELIGGHLGVEMNFWLLDSKDDSEAKKPSWKEQLEAIWESLIFWED